MANSGNPHDFAGFQTVASKNSDDDNMLRKIFLLTICLATASSSLCFGQAKTLAPGVLKVVPTAIEARDTYSVPMPLLGLDSKPFQPNFAPFLDTLHGQTQNVVFFRDVWQYEFGFTGLRQATIPLRTANGTINQNVWYMVMRVRNTGVNAVYEKVKEDERFEHIKYSLKRNDEKYEVKSRFKLDFYLNGWVREGNSYREVSYRDQLNPEAQKRIRDIEDSERFLLDKVEMMFAKFPLAKGANDGERWGVAIWKDVDPRLDYISVTVRGLTNAFRIQTTAGGERKLKHRNLQLNFWRPGDTVAQDRDDVAFGIPLVDNAAEQVDICRKYRLPGPLIRGYQISTSANQNVLVAELDAKIDLTDFQSALTPLLDQGKMPAELAAAFKNAGVTAPGAVKLKTEILGKKWTFATTIGDKTESFVIQVEPQYWETSGDRIRFIKSLDHLWIYR